MELGAREPSTEWQLPGISGWTLQARHLRLFFLSLFFVGVEGQALTAQFRLAWNLQILPPQPPSAGITGCPTTPALLLASSQIHGRKDSASHVAAWSPRPDLQLFSLLLRKSEWESAVVARGPRVRELSACPVPVLFRHGPPAWLVTWWAGGEVTTTWGMTLQRGSPSWPSGNHLAIF